MRIRHSSWLKHLEPPQSLIRLNNRSFLIIGAPFFWFFCALLSGLWHCRKDSIICFLRPKFTSLSGMDFLNSIIISRRINFNIWYTLKDLLALSNFWSITTWFTDSRFFIISMLVMITKESNRSGTTQNHMYIDRIMPTPPSAIPIPESVNKLATLYEK